MRDTCPQSAAVGVVAIDAARRLSTFWYSSLTAMQGDVLQGNASLPAFKSALSADTSRKCNFCAIQASACTQHRDRSPLTPTE